MAQSLLLLQFIISKRMRPTLLKRSVKPERRSGKPSGVATQGGVKVSTIVPRDDVIVPIHYIGTGTNFSI